MNRALEKIKQIKKLIKNADYILIGAGAGLSTAAGIEYFGKRFTENFAEFIEKYHFTDMYSSGFHDFETEEEISHVNPGKAEQKVLMKLPIKTEKDWILRRKK